MRFILSKTHFLTSLTTLLCLGIWMVHSQHDTANALFERLSNPVIALTTNAIFLNQRVGISVARHYPRANPDVRCECIRLLPRVIASKRFCGGADGKYGAAAVNSQRSVRSSASSAVSADADGTGNATSSCGPRSRTRRRLGYLRVNSSS